jgi:alpha-glucosidase (family GH31 glycosyl hydrolase)
MMMEQNDFLERIRLAGHAHAQPMAVIARGTVRFMVLTARLVRLEWSPSGAFTDAATFAFPHRSSVVPPFTLHENDEVLTIDTGALRLTYRLGSGRFTADNVTITLRDGTTWHPGQPDSGNLGGTRRTLDDTGGDVPLEPGLLSRDGWALFDDSQGVVFSTEAGWVQARPDRTGQDWYFFGYGHAYTDALAEYTRFGGAVPLIPRYVLGIWWSRFWPYSDDDLRHLVADFADHQMPLDVLVVDMDWHTPGHWTGYSWNHELFPDPAGFLAEMHAQGLRVTLNLHPADGILPHETAYADFAAALGADATAGAPIPFRIADPTFAEAYFRLLHHPLEDQGVDFWWIDWQQGENTEIAGLDPLIWLNHLHFADARRRGQRPLLFSRWGGLGNHRYPLGFSGDTFGGWATLAALPRFTATAANVGFGWWSHDIGGHFGAVAPELFVRWVQFGALSPCLRLHATKDPLGERRPWAFPTPYLEAARQAFALRYQLIPYLYTMARETHDRGVAPCRPMYYAYPNHEAAYEAHGQYLLGDDLIAAPITQAADEQTGLADVDVWLPPGTWYRFDTGAACVGPRWVRLAGDLTTMPLFARAGAIIPLATPALHLADIPADHVELRIMAGANGSFRLYEDDGASEGYRLGAFEWTTITSTAHGPRARTVHIAPVEGHCPALPTSRSYTLTFFGVTVPEDVRDSAGQRLAWRFDQAAQRLSVAVPAAPKDTPLAIAVRWATEANAASPQAATAPFAHAVAHTANDAQAATLGSVLLVPPYAASGQPLVCAAELVWHYAHATEAREVVQTLRDIRAATTVPVPFALAPTVQPQEWSCTVRFLGNGAPPATVLPGSRLQPPIQQWQVCYAGQPAWQEVRADRAPRTNLTDPFTVLLDAQQGTMAEALATIDLPEATTLACDTWANGTLALQIDGQTLDDGTPQATIAGLARHWPGTRFGPQTLAAGRHTISVRVAAPEDGPWLFGVLLVDAAGLPLMRVASVT